MRREDPPRDDHERRLGSIVGGKYRIDRLLGKGGMGAVFAAENMAIGKRVALKFLGSDAARRFQREAKAASLIESEHIVQVFDTGTSEDGLPFLVMEQLTGEDLRAKLTRTGQLPVSEALAIASQVLRALVRAHAAGIVHRDLKPDNVFLCARDDGSVLVKLVDFGISKLERGTMSERLTRRGTVLGSAYYMSPEQAQASDDVDQRADLYGVGAMLFEMLAGRPPHLAPTLESVLVAICTQTAPSVRSFRPDVSEELALAIARALEREPSARFQSATAMLEALGQLGSGSPRLARRGPSRTVVAGVLASLIGFTLTAILISSRAPAGAPAAPAHDPLGTPATAPEAAAGAVIVPPSTTPVVTPVAVAPGATLPVASPSPSPRASETARQTAARVAAKPAPEHKHRSAPAPDAGVASSLKLSTREP
jgi:serine/threonine protein kinase